MSTAYDAVKAIQQILGAGVDGVMRPGGETETLFKHLMALGPVAPWPPVPVAEGDVLRGDGTWPFTARIEGEDIVVDDIVITCFGGLFDPQDDGNTASGVNTKTHPDIEGVSLAMDGRLFSRLSPREHAALDGSPIPRLPWGTPVAVTIDGDTFTPAAGVIDLGPGVQASRTGAPHGLDLTESAAAHFAPRMALRELSRNFEMRGSFRVLGGAKYARSV